eukprot:CAMPEP_0178967984 /NCGR_PEP_ID=MMETSP0789-20121207/17943_1 /TAXON_ID=3005 /ORGANISM="Rhizosolenia setigera, Strain CCMP 1694" /LENGTH=256 /DNA_ID=CAMNT_0020653745 /DNA_START=128 /DNA_END=898 /DNA_ORIENTATION=+
MTQYRNYSKTFFVLSSLICGFEAWSPSVISTTCNTRSFAHNSRSKQHDTSLNSVGKGKKAMERKIDNFLDFIESPVENDRFPVDQPTEGSEEDVSPNLDPLAPLVETIVKAADMRKAEDISAIRVSKLTAMTSFVVVLSGNSRPQNQAIAAAIMDEVSEDFDGMRTRGNGVPEGDADSGWILLDYGDVMVHIMTPKSRLFYDIEGKWEGGEEMDLSGILVPNLPPGATQAQASGQQEAQIGGGMAGLDEEEDPFWS